MKINLHKNAKTTPAQRAFIQNELTDETAVLIELGMQHEQQHQELFWTDLKYTLGHNPMYPAYDGQLPISGNANFDSKLDFISMEEGVYEIGHQGEGFCYDNELDRHKVYLQNYSIGSRPVTNGEYLEFMDDGGYQNFDLWHDEAWKWLRENNVKAPLHWHLKDGKWMHYTLSGLHEVHRHKLVTHISYYEAYAYANWKGMRLPTEFEWEIAADSLKWGQRWEWTESAYLPYPGYKKADGAVGEYNGKFMVNQKVLRGASVVTSENHSRKTYRNFFHPDVGYQFNGIRLARG